MNPIIETVNLTHIYSEGTPFERMAIENVNFKAYKGEHIAIIGHTGSGKSTLVQHLNGLIAPTRGQVLFDGQDIFSSKETTRAVRFKVGLVFQYPEYQLFEETVYKDISFGPKNMGLDAREIDRRVRTAAELIGLPAEYLDRSPFDLSGGEKRRVAFAGVMAMRPDVLVLDEPTAGLDPGGCREIEENIERFMKDSGATVITVTHDMEAAARIADRLCVMNGGRLVLDGTPAEVFSHEKEITESGLEIPDVTKIMRRLREMGLPVPTNIYTVEQARDALLRLKGGDGIC